jgi:hypothetical protein
MPVAAANAVTATCGDADGEHVHDIVIGVPALNTLDANDASSSHRQVGGPAGFGARGPDD